MVVACESPARAFRDTDHKHAALYCTYITHTYEYVHEYSTHLVPPALLEPISLGVALLLERLGFHMSSEVPSAARALCAVGLDGFIERGKAASVLDLLVGEGLGQALRHLDHPVSRREVEGCVAVLVDGVDFQPETDEQGHLLSSPLDSCLRCMYRRICAVPLRSNR